MGTNEMLQRSIAYEESVLRNYTQYAKQAEETDAGVLFAELAKEKAVHLEKLKAMLKSYCKP